MRTTRNAFRRLAKTLLVGLLVFILAAQPVLAAGVWSNDDTNHAPEAPSGLLTNQAEYPMNVEGVPQFDWWINDADYDEVQTAYQVRVYDGITDALVWDSGKVESAQQNSVNYGGDALKAGYPYSWEVSTWDAQDEQSPFSERAKFATGLSDEDWGATWIQGHREITASPLGHVTETAEDGTTIHWGRANNNGVVLLNQGLEWTDYTLSFDAKITGSSFNIIFRAPDEANSGYLWALMNSGNLRTHVGENGRYTRLQEVPLGLKTNTVYHVDIAAVGNNYTTYLNGEKVYEVEIPGSLQGTIGLQTSRGQSGQITNVVVTDPEGAVLYEDDFSEGPINWGTAAKALTTDNSYWYNRKEVALEEGKEIKAAHAYISGSQDYELMINGTRIGRGQTYDYLGETKYQGWEITDAVKGEDSIVVGVLASYYGGGQGRASSLAGLLGKVIIYYTDGSTQEIVTDETWLTHATAYSNSGARNGEGDEIEYIDGRKMLHGWSEPGYDTTDWKPVWVHGAHPTEKFTSLEAELGHVTETVVSPVSVTKLEDGTTVADFGKVIPARIAIHFPDGTEGTQILIQEGYELNEDGTINTNMASTQNTDMRYYYTMVDGEQDYEAWFYMGFRYVSVPAAAGDLTAEDFSAIIVHTEVVSDRESTLETSNDMLNEVYEFMKRTSLYSVQNEFVDTPTREKGQFSGDAILISAATTAGYYERLTSRKAIIQFLDSADRFWNSGNKLGMINAVYPNNDNGRDIPEYSLNFPTMIWNYYLQTGDTELLEYAYPYMLNTADYVGRNTNAETGLVTAIYGGSGSYAQGIVDWPAAGRFDYDWNGTRNGVRTTINALSVRTLDTVALMAQELGREEEALALEAQRDALKAAMNTYLIGENGLYVDGLTSRGVQSAVQSQHSNSYAIAFGIAEGETYAAAAEYIAGLGMRQGPMTAEVLVNALFESGQTEAAIRLMTNTEDYGWAKLINEGYTFTWEQWQYGESQSHGWGGSSVEHVLEHVGAVEVVEAAAKTVRIAPVQGVLDWVNSHVVTARGAVDVSYSGSGADLEITVNVPANMTAEVVFPLVEGGKFVEVNGRNGVNAFADGVQIMTVGSGERTFKLTSDVVIDVAGAGDVTVNDESASFTVSVANALDLATLTLTLEANEYLGELTAEAIGDNYILAQTYENGVLTVVVCNNAGIDGDADLLTVSADVVGEVGDAVLTVTSAVLSTYSGASEVFVPAVLGEAGVVKVDYSVYDVNKDGTVDQLDITRAQRFFGTDNADANVNGDEVVDINDLILILNNYSK